MKAAWALAVMAGTGMGAAHAALDPSRFHCVDYSSSSGNLLMRSNMPIASNASGVLEAEDFAYSEIVDLVQQRAPDCGAEAPETFYLVEVTLNNALDDKSGLVAVKAWHAMPDHFSLGRLVEWPIGVAGIIPPARVPEDKWQTVATNMFVVDQLPERVAMLDQLMAMPSPTNGFPVVTLVHCTAGCDRTGEMIGAYRMAKGSISAEDMYALDVSECGRPPNYYSTHALEWYCILLEGQGYTSLGDCTGFATCEPLGDCTPTNPTTGVGKEKRRLR